MMLKRFFKYSLGIIAVSLVLGGCSLSAASLNSEEVMEKFSEALSGLGSFHYEAELNLQGSFESGLSDGLTSSRMRFVGDVMSANAVSPEFTLLAQIYADSVNGPLSITGQVIGLQNYTYFKLTDLLMPTLLPISIGADSRWYRIKHTANMNEDPNILGSGETSTISPEQLEAICELIANYPLFEVVEELPDETVAGQRSYHYLTKLKPDIFQQIVRQLSQILQTDNPAIDSNLIENYLIDIWISKRSFDLTKLTVASNYIANGEIIEFDFNLEMSNHNQQLTITAPEIAEDIDGLNWLTNSDLF